MVWMSSVKKRAWFTVECLHHKLAEGFALKFMDSIGMHIEQISPHNLNCNCAYRHTQLTQLNKRISQKQLQEKASDPKNILIRYLAKGLSFKQ